MEKGASEHMHQTLTFCSMSFHPMCGRLLPLLGTRICTPCPHPDAPVCVSTPGLYWGLNRSVLAFLCLCKLLNYHYLESLLQLLDHYPQVIGGDNKGSNRVIDRYLEKKRKAFCRSFSGMGVFIPAHIATARSFMTWKLTKLPP